MRIHAWETPEIGGDEYVSAKVVASRDTEAREVLEGLVTSVIDGEYCWCDVDHAETPHMPACLAAQGLWERVQS